MKRRSPEVRTAWGRYRATRAARELILMRVLWPLIRHYTAPRVLGFHHFQDLPYPAILAAPHTSHLDTPVILGALPPPWRRRTVVVAAADYFYRSRLKGALVTLVFGTEPIERRGGSRNPTSRIELLLGEGWNILLYPEGTRSRDGAPGRLRTGAALLATTKGLPIIPIHVDGTYEAMPRGRRWPRAHPVTVAFGAPLWPAPEESARALTERLAAALTRLRQEVRRGS